jgi:cytochrome c oxidase subunit IV
MLADREYVAGAAPPKEPHAEPNYMGVFLGLTVLTVVEVLVAFVSHLPKSVLIVALLGLAVWKALLVALYYMHLKFEPRKLWLVALSPLPLAILLVVAVLLERF